MKSILGLFFCFLLIPTHAQKYIGNDQDISVLLKNIKLFSQAVMDGNSEGIGMVYSKDAKIFPSNKNIIEGREAIISYWTPTNGSRIVFHKISPEEIKVIGNEAYDYGYYEGITKNKDGKLASWKGKYVILWKKVGKKWLIYLDIWNRVQTEKKNK